MFSVVALYRFTHFADPESLRLPLLQTCEADGVKGTLLLAHEGINGTIAGTEQAISNALQHIRSFPNCQDIDYKTSTAQEMPFGRMKIRVKPEIVTMGQEDIDPNARSGHYVAPKDWDALCAKEDVVLIDTRNDYEYEIGTFRDAINPETRTFREFPHWWQENKAELQDKKIAMFCTGGIRCEKASNYLLGQGAKEVYHLHGGILKYLEEMPIEESSWQGECFVFDRRVAVGHGLEEGTYSICFGCRMPLTPIDRDRAEFEDGVSCHHCLHKTSPEKRAGFRERQRQLL